MIDANRSCKVSPPRKTRKKETEDKRYTRDIKNIIKWKKKCNVVKTRPMMTRRFAETSQKKKELKGNQFPKQQINGTNKSKHIQNEE